MAVPYVVIPKGKVNVSFEKAGVRFMKNKSRNIKQLEYGKIKA